MLRKILLYLSGAHWARRFVTHFPPSRWMARRFVAGETVDEALHAAARLQADGLSVSLDYLGESVTNAADTQVIRDTYITLIEHIHSQGLQGSVSLKLTHLGLDISEDVCVDNVRRIIAAAAAHDIPVTIDMESSDYTDTTLRIYRMMRDECGFGNAGTVIQAALRRSSDDMQALAAEGARVRLCKGAYLEPPEVAYPRKDDVDVHFRQIMDDFLQHCPPACLEIATHDDTMIDAAKQSIRAYDVPSHGYEFQMLYGIRSSLQTELARDGYPTRVYLPFGEAWYAYFMRRLAERPANLLFFLRSLVRS